MLKQILVLLFVTFSITAYSQNKNSLLFSYYPQDNGIGLRYDRYFDKIGVYCSYSYGNYHGEDQYKCEYNIDDHNKYAAGVALRAKSNPTYLLLGLSYHTYGDMDLTPDINRDAFMPFSVEFGVKADINHFAAGFRMDPIKWEGCFEIGINF